MHRENEADLEGPVWQSAEAELQGSAEGRAWKENLHNEICRQAEKEASRGAIELHVTFFVGAARTAWGTLWKPTIDALGPILGLDVPTRSSTLGTTGSPDLASIALSNRADATTFASSWRGAC